MRTVVDGDQKAPFSIATTPMCRGALLLSLDCSTLPLIRTLSCWVLSKEVSRTILKVFDMMRPGIESRSPESLANTLTTRQWHKKNETLNLSYHFCPFTTEGNQSHWELLFSQKETPTKDIPIECTYYIAHDEHHENGFIIALGNSLRMMNLLIQWMAWNFAPNHYFLTWWKITKSISKSCLKVYST